MDCLVGRRTGRPAAPHVGRPGYPRTRDGPHVFPLDDHEPHADDPRDWSGFVSTAGILGGCLTGLAFQQRYARFSAAGPVETRILRFMLGIIGVLLIWYGLTIFLPHGTGLIAQIGRFVRYALTGVWTVYVAPIVFLRTGLALLPQDVVCVGRSENDTTGPRES